MDIETAVDQEYDLPTYEIPTSDGADTGETIPDEELLRRSKLGREGNVDARSLIPTGEEWREKLAREPGQIIPGSDEWCARQRYGTLEARAVAAIPTGDGGVAAVVYKCPSADAKYVIGADAAIEEQVKPARRAWRQADVAKLLTAFHTADRSGPNYDGPFSREECDAKLIELGVIPKPERPGLTDKDRENLDMIVDDLRRLDQAQQVLVARYLIKRLSEVLPKRKQASE